MVKGKDLSLSDRQLICQHVMLKNRSPKYIHEHVFNKDNTKISISRLITLVAMFKNKNCKHTHKIDNYVYSKNNRDNNGKNHRNFFQESKNDIIRILEILLMLLYSNIKNFILILKMHHIKRL